MLMLTASVLGQACNKSACASSLQAPCGSACVGRLVKMPQPVKSHLKSPRLQQSSKDGANQTFLQSTVKIFWGLGQLL